MAQQRDLEVWLERPSSFHSRHNSKPVPGVLRVVSRHHGTYEFLADSGERISLHCSELDVSRHTLTRISGHVGHHHELTSR